MIGNKGISLGLGCQSYGVGTGLLLDPGDDGVSCSSSAVILGNSVLEELQCGISLPAVKLKYKKYTCYISVIACLDYMSRE